MLTSLVTVKNKFQVVIPQSVRDKIAINVGDPLEAKALRGKIVFEPKALVDSGIAESIAEFKVGRNDGPGPMRLDFGPHFPEWVPRNGLSIFRLPNEI